MHIDHSVPQCAQLHSFRFSAILSAIAGYKGANYNNAARWSGYRLALESAGSSSCVESVDICCSKAASSAVSGDGGMEAERSSVAA